MLSALPEASSFPSGEKATEVTRKDLSAEGAQLAPAGYIPELDGLSSLPEAACGHPAKGDGVDAAV